jgi:hypothetical protein
MVDYHSPNLPYRTYGFVGAASRWNGVLLLHIPQMRDARAKAEAQRVLEISQENKPYCEKWGCEQVLTNT